MSFPARREEITTRREEFTTRRLEISTRRVGKNSPGLFNEMFQMPARSQTDAKAVMDKLFNSSTF